MSGPTDTNELLGQALKTREINLKLYLIALLTDILTSSWKIVTVPTGLSEKTRTW